MNVHFREGLEANITGTPGFVINGDFISGAQPVEVFTATIEKHAASADVGYAASFLGGVLTLVSPCSALLLLAFFAYAFGSQVALLACSLLFLAGLLTTLVPLVWRHPVWTCYWVSIAPPWS